jgi:DNA-binding IclR family transcriptional regulator
LLAALPPAQVRALFPTPETFVRRTDQGPQTLSQLRRLLADERRQGYAVEDSHVTPGVASVASAALDHAGHPVASISVSFRSEAIPPPERPLLARRVRQTADALTRRLRG